LHCLFHCSADGIAVRFTQVTDMLLLHIAVQGIRRLSSAAFLRLFQGAGD
jgi:hypothetical protein